jgi:hypothetical protein
MIWLTWRQFRAQSIVAVVVLALFAAALLATGPNLAHLYDASGLSACRVPSDCPKQTTVFLARMKADSTYPALYFTSLVVVTVAPGLIGVFWGAPLIPHELEAGTFPLVWNQSVTRARWAAVKLGLLALAAIAVTGLLSLLTTWWAGPIDRAGGFPAGTTRYGRFSSEVFDARGVAPMAYAAFAFVVGVVVGMLVRRTVPAMAVTLLVFAAVQVLTPNVIRPALFTPAHSTSAPLSAAALDGMVVDHGGHVIMPVDLPGSWVVSNQTIAPDGREYLLPDDPHCGGGKQACVDWLATQNLRQYVTYQPANRYWTFQWAEAAQFTAVSAVLAACCVSSIRRGRVA